jgi:thiol-disulfide isomerase/thioredoxin
MKALLVSIVLLAIQLQANSQSAAQLVAAIQKAQGQLQQVSYSLQRTDTFVTGQVRAIHGKTIIQRDKKDSVLGFQFWSKRDDIDRETIYDGRLGYEVHHTNKTYEITNGRIVVAQLIGSPGGQVLFPNLVKLDTTGAISMETAEDAAFYYLTLHYPDIKEYDVSKRYTTLSIDKQRMLPVRMRSHQETLGKVQDLSYTIKDLAINETALTYDFSTKAFLNDYTQAVRQPSKALLSLKDKAAPPFELISFTEQPISSTQFKGKVVLLDFWEVWCSPCIASMPKVQALYDKYKDKGLLVYGISNETDQLEPAKKLVAKRGINFPMLKGNEQIKNTYSVNAIPLYILINKTGTISYLTEGYSEAIEAAIVKALGE